jgi:predicted ribosomally synthesized peptide with nif11-like leader
MSQAAAEAFLDRIENDEAFAAELESRRANWQEVHDLIRSEGFDADPTEIREAFLERFGTQLSPEQLDEIAAGADLVAIGVGAGVGGVVVGIGAAAAAAIC